MVDDHGMDDEGDQRVQDIAYNPERNEFLASWWDSRPSLDEQGVVGRIISSDGSPYGPDFVVADAPGRQTYPHLEYVEEKGQYFGIWVDSRNDDGTGNTDIYAKWLNPSGEPAGSDIPIGTEMRAEKYSAFAYNPVMDRFLIVWRDEVEEEVLSEGGSGHVTESGGNTMGKIYGVPSFLTARVVEQGTGTPVEGARVAIIGLGLLEMETTNIGGWCNIAKDTQRNGRYFIIVQKKGYRIAIASVTYEGESLNITIELK
jgi:hypothetical protein